MAETQGQSEHTEEKEKVLAKILGQHLRICEAILRKPYIKQRTYQYVDMFAGCGHNKLVDCPGSPVVFLDAMRCIDMAYSAAFIENNPGNARELGQCVARYNHGANTVYAADNAVQLPLLLDQMPPGSFGILYADPNNLPPFDLLGEASRHPNANKLDILIYASATTIKRVRKAQEGKPDLRGYLAMIDKKHWVVRDPSGMGKQQWTFLLGTNWVDYPRYKSIGFHRLDSPEGRRIFPILNYTQGELAGLQQPKLVAYSSYPEYLQLPEFKAIRAQVMERANGICEQCGERRATEPHHLRYPAWGTLDVPENMIAVCHPCHCVIHGKEN